MRVALIELSNSHDECLFTQVLFLASRPDIHLTMIYNQLLESKVSDYEHVDEFIPMRIRENKSLKTWKDITMVRRRLLQKQFDLLIFNTAQGALMKNLMILGLRNKKAIGILHNIKKLEVGIGQKIISKNLKSYFVLNNFLKQKIEQEDLSIRPIHVFYPVFFRRQNELELEKRIGDIWITIPGQVEMKRRDIQSLLNALKTQKLSSHIKIIFLGRSYHTHGDGRIVTQIINELDLSEQVWTWEDFIPLDKFQAILDKSDYIMPLIHRSHVSYKLYEAQISGSFNLGIGYKIPFLLERDFNMYEDLRRNAAFYDLSNMIETINQLPPKQKDFDYNKKWSFDFQCQNYMKVVNELLN